MSFFISLIAPNIKIMNDKMYKRSQSNRMLFGVCGGLAEYTNTDATLWRLLFVLLIFTAVPIILLYIVTTLITTN